MFRGQERPKFLCERGINTHSWSSDGRTVAVVPNTKEVLLYKVTGDDCSTWELLETLSEHEQPVLALDWGPNTNRLLSCSEDRTANVWEWHASKKAWQPTLVQFDTSINRGALCCKWSPTENKLAVGTGAKLVCVCYFEKEQNWWVSKTIQGFHSSVTALAWNPQNNGVLAACATDNTVRLFSAYIKSVDKDHESPGKFGTLLAEFTAKGWTKDVAWSPNGQWLAFCAHDSTLSVVDTAANNALTTLKLKALPFKSLVFPNDTTIVAASNDCFVYVFNLAGSRWACQGRLQGAATEARKMSTVSAARLQFQLADATGQTEAIQRLPSKHQNAISCVRVVKGGADWRVSTSAYDGCVYLWGPKDLQPL
eukprot:NODE_2471_length_1167_cov_113.238462_g2355_i0.p1 GENE.NODE_2471_length_1167_cov_113.238462_g2355_i0~~NODE_2471_length_1167_cov_113.238462_g2355_i0.p1  ORF type:complete len:386 (-),score=76.92 NODE_2471_length_1167_cov_113.238462_g2355_i0:10-1110(-)